MKLASNRRNAIQRRTFLQRSGLLAAGAWMACGPTGPDSDGELPGEAEAEALPIALQLYSVRDAAPDDFPGVLEAVAQMGYQGVEFAGYHGHEAAQLRRILDDLELRSAGSHVRLAALMDDEIERTIEFNQILGSLFLVVPFHAEERPETLDGWRGVADVFNRISERLQPYGMRVGYHNYDREFAPIEGGIPWMTFAAATRPEVTLQLDTAAATRGGGDLMSLLTAHPGRFHTVHLEDHSPDGSVVLPGDGVVPFREVIRFCRERGGSEWLIIEQEQHPEGYTSLEGVRECLNRIRAMQA